MLFLPLFLLKHFNFPAKILLLRVNRCVYSSRNDRRYKKACQVMNEGGVILYPTDTIWGIGCDATNEEAVRRV